MNRPRRPARFLNTVALIVPSPERAAWLREWDAELTFHLQAGAETRQQFWLARRLWAAFRHALFLRVSSTLGADAPARVWTGLFDDVRYSVRGIRRTPAFSLTVILTLALGVGLISGILAFADGYLFRPLPFPGADRAYYVRDPNGRIASSLSAADARILRESPLGHYGFVEWSISNAFHELTIDGTSLSAFAYEVSPGFRKVLQLPMRAGRDFAPDDHAEGAPLVAWVSHRFWHRAFGGDPDVLERVIRGASTGGPMELRIVGILGPEVATFDQNNEPPDFVVPARGRPREGPNRLAFPLVRLPDDVSVDQATIRLASILQAGAPAADGRPRAVRLSSFDRAQRGGGAPTARILFAGALLIMLLASMNLLHLMLGRGEARTSEAATRMALGASRWRVTRAFAVESLVLGSVGIVLGLGAGKLFAMLIAARIPELPTSGRNLSMMPVIFDGRVMFLAAVFGLIASLAGGLWPARRAWRTALGARVRGTTRRSATLARAILASELAVVTVVATGAVFAGTGIYRYLNKPLGFEITDRVEVRLRTDVRISGPDLLAAVAAVQATSGVQAAALEDAPVQGQAPVEIPGVSMDTERMTPAAVPQGLFEAWGWKMAAGRWFTGADYSTDDDVVVVNEHFARAGWPNGGAIGSAIRTGTRLRRIVGVVQSHQWRLDMPIRPQLFVPAPGGAGAVPIVAWAPGIPAGEIQSRIEAAVNAAVPGLRPRARALTFDDFFARGIGEARFQGPLVVTFAVLGADLAVVGVFGIVSFLAAQRTREFGIRLALGARRKDVRMAVVRESLYPALIGVAFGSLGAWMLSRVVKSAVFDWEASAVQSVAVVVAGTLVVAVVAALAPASRAAKTDPAISLRVD
jgi:putative ABC transport system permease protein